MQAQLADVVVGDLSSESDIATALAGIRYVYHLARPVVKTWAEFTEHEVEATRRVAHACLAANVKRLIYTGTIDAYYAVQSVTPSPREHRSIHTSAGVIIMLNPRLCPTS